MPNPKAGYDDEEIRHRLDLDLVGLLFLRPPNYCRTHHPNRDADLALRPRARLDWGTDRVGGTHQV
jgi:hypothetical protein